MVSPNVASWMTCLPRDAEDWKLVNALLIERQALRTEGKLETFQDAQQLLF